MYHKVRSMSFRFRLGLATEWIEIVRYDIDDTFHISLGLATEWIEMIRMRKKLSKSSGLGLATEWIEISHIWTMTRHHPVSVLRPSGLKSIINSIMSSSSCLGLATEWIEMFPSEV